MRFALITILLGLAGCAASYHVPPGREAAYARDRNACQAEAFNVYPNIAYTPKEDPQGMRGLGDQLGRNNYEERCMNGRGYRSK
jgi:hypothetical protein